jgi:hypothetical protein
MDMSATTFDIALFLWREVESVAAARLPGACPLEMYQFGRRGAAKLIGRRANQSRIPSALPLVRYVTRAA